MPKKIEKMIIEEKSDSDVGLIKSLKLLGEKVNELIESHNSSLPKVTKAKKILDYSLTPRDVDLSKIKKLQIACGFCSEVATMCISDNMDMTEEIMEYMEKELKGWQRSHCKHFNRI